MKHIFIWTLLGFFTITLAGMQKGNIAGKINDNAGKQPLVGANVVVENTVKGAVSDMEGNYFIKGLEPGSYNISFQFLGYKTVLKSNVIVNPGKTTVLSVDMEPDILESRSIEVTASYFQKPADAVVSSRSVDMEEIRRAPGSNLDIQRVMQALPAVVSASDQNNEIIIRGGNPGENLFMMDEIEIPNPNHFSQQGTGGGPINMINTLMVRSVDFYAGAFPAKYGDKASSVMDISLRDGSRENFQSKLDVGMAGAGFLVEGPLNSGKGSYIFSARKSYLDLLTGSLGLTAIPRYWNAQGKVTYNLNKNNTLLFNALYGADDITIENEGSGGYARGAENVASHGNQYAFGATLRTMWSPQLYSKTTLSVVQSERHNDVYRLEENKKNTYFKENSIFNEITIKTHFGYQTGKNSRVNFGASVKNVKMKPGMSSLADTIFIYDTAKGNPDSVIGIKQIVPDWQSAGKEYGNKYALYAHFSSALFKRLHFSAGLRYQYFDLNKYHSLSPRLNLSWSFTPKTSVSIAYGKHFQSPDAINFGWNKANTDLTSYNSEQFVLGFERIIGEDIRFTAETYYKKYANLPVFKRYTTGDPFDFYQNRMENSGSGKAYGVELFLQKKLTQNFSSIISYSYSRSQTKDLRSGDMYNGDYDYRNVFTFIGGYKIRYYKKGWFQTMKKTWWYKTFAFALPLSDEIEWSLKYRYLGGRPYTPKVYHPEYKRWITDETAAFNTERLPAYSRLDVRLDRRSFFDSWNLVSYFDISNVLDHKNIWEYQYNNETGTKEEVLQFQPFFVGGIIIEF